MSSLGNHFLLDLYGCKQALLAEVSEVEAAMLSAAEAADATILHSVFHQFSPAGVSGVIVIQESHLTIHTWPELGYAAVDVFTCGIQMNPELACDKLAEHLQAKNQQLRRLERGANLIEGLAKSRHLDLESALRNVWFTQRTESLAFSLRHAGDIVYRTLTHQQKVVIYDTLAFGRMLSLDGKVAVAEGDEYIYHEMLVHVPMQSLYKVRDVLIIGGGDGAAAREALRYDSVESIGLIEQDMEVVSAVKTHFKQLIVPWEDERLQIFPEEGRAYIESAVGQSVDLLILDAYVWDQADPNHELEGVIRAMWRLLRPGGALIVQSGAPRLEPKQFTAIVEAVQQVAGKSHASPYLTYVPTYPTGTWSFVMAIRDAQSAFQKSCADRFSAEQGLRYYNGAVHEAAFALPNDVRTLLP